MVNIKKIVYSSITIIFIWCLFNIQANANATNTTTIDPTIELSYATTAGTTNSSEKSALSTMLDTIITNTKAHMNPATKYVSGYNAGQPVWKTTDNGKLGFLTYTDDSTNKVYKVTIYLTDYRELDQDVKVDVLQECYDAIDNSQVSTVNKTRLYNFIEKNDSVTSALAKSLSSDMRPNYYDAYFSFIKPFNGVIGTLLGLFVLAIFLLLTATILCDISYIVLPFVQSFVDTKKDKDGLFGRLSFVSKDAKLAVKEGYTNVDSVNPLGIYFGMKWKQFAILSICILYLVSGQIYDLLARLIDLFVGFLH